MRRTRWVLVAAAMTLAACTTSAGNEHAVGGDTAAESALSAPGTDWDDVPFDAEAVRAANLRQFAEVARIDNPPDVDIVAEVALDEVGYRQAQCMQEAGYPVEASQGGVVLAGQVADPGAYNLALYVCTAQYPTDPRASLPLPRVRAEVQYEYLVNVATPCVEELGFPVEEPPSLQAWLDAYYGASGVVWDPFGAVTSAPDALDAVYGVCSPNAPDLYP